MPEQIVADVDPDTNRTAGLNTMKEKLDALMGEVRANQGSPKQTSTQPDKPPPDAAPIPKPVGQTPPDPVKPVIQSPEQKLAEAPKMEAKRDDDVPASIKSEKAADDWRILKKSKEEYKTKAEQLEARTKELETKLAAAPKIDLGEIETLRKQKAEAEEFVKKFAIEHDPRFQEQYNTKIEAGLARIKSVVGGAEGEKLALLAKLPDSQYRTEQIESILNELPAFKRTRFAVVAEELDKVIAERETIVKQARDNFSQLEKQNQEQISAREEGQRKARAQILDEVVEGLRDPKHGLPIFQTKDGDAEWNTKVGERIETLRAITNGEYSGKDMVRWNAWAVAAPSLLNTCKEQAAEIERLTTQLKELSTTQPKVEGQSGKQGETKETGNLEGSFMRKYNSIYTPKT